mmetsp:Transcript_36220/g.96232  ORF Transcript_36220/g.96232 Transcript_36220/m.96232 type:complete len:117 (-) Transcript_36220:1417-1767(-)
MPRRTRPPSSNDLGDTMSANASTSTSIYRRPPGEDAEKHWHSCGTHKSYEDESPSVRNRVWASVVWETRGVEGGQRHRALLLVRSAARSKLLQLHQAVGEGLLQRLLRLQQRSMFL